MRELMDRLKDAIGRSEAGKEVEAKGKKQWQAAEAEIKEIRQEFLTGEPQRPMLDRIDAAERSRQSARDPAEQPAEGGTDFFGKRSRRRKGETVG